MPLIFTQPYFYTAISNPLAGDPNNTTYTNVSLLMHFDGNYTDSSIFNNTNIGVPIGGVTFSTTNTKFGTASVYFNGGGGYAQLANSPQYSFGTGDFTIEAWVYPESLTGTNGASTIVAGLGTNSDGGGYDRWVFYILSNGALSFANGESAGAANQFSVSTEGGIVATDKWQHVAVTRSNGVMQFFVDGVAKQGVSKNGVEESAPVTSNGPLRFGRLFSGGSWTFLYKGFMDEVRITRGAARYTRDFTAPTEPFVPSPATLVTRFDGSAGSTVFTNDAGANLNRFGNVVLSSAQAKFGTTSAYFDGAGDYLTTPVSANFGFGTGDFTVELWFYPTNGAKTTGALFDLRDPGNWQAMKPTAILSGNKVTFSSAGVSKATSGTLADNTWHHIAHSRVGGVSRYFVNGVMIGEVPDTNNYAASSDVVFGQVSEARTTWDGYFIGYMDGIRILKGAGAYTANFTPPTEPF